MRALRAALRRGVAVALSLAGPRGTKGLRILTYHRVNDRHPNDRLTVHPEAFRWQMQALRESGRKVLSLREAVAALRGGVPFSEGAVVLTFDDGYADNHEAALPILERLGLKATFFLATGFMGTRTTLDRYRGCCAHDGMLAWDDVRDLLARGHEVGGHGRAHVELGTASPSVVDEEIEGCAQDIRQQTGERPRFFCYPRGSEGPSVRQALAARGFEAACTVYPGANLPGAALLGLARTEIAGGDDLRDFRLKLRGAFDAWHVLVQKARGRGPRH